MTDKRAAFRAALREAREAAGLTQRQLAEAVGVAGQTTVQQWESGRGGWDVPPEKVFKLEEVLRLAPGTLSRHLGYLPVTSGGQVNPITFQDFLVGLNEERLTQRQRRVLLDVYREFVGETKAGRPRKGRPAGDVAEARLRKMQDELSADTRRRRTRQPAAGD